MYRKIAILVLIAAPILAEVASRVAPAPTPAVPTAAPVPTAAIQQPRPQPTPYTASPQEGLGGVNGFDPKPTLDPSAIAEAVSNPTPAMEPAPTPVAGEQPPPPLAQVEGPGRHRPPAQ